MHAALNQIKRHKRTQFFDWRAKGLAFLCRYLLPKAVVAKFSLNLSSKNER